MLSRQADRVMSSTILAIDLARGDGLDQLRHEGAEGLGAHAADCVMPRFSGALKSCIDVRDRQLGEIARRVGRFPGDAQEHRVVGDSIEIERPRQLELVALGVGDRFAAGEPVGIPGVASEPNAKASNEYSVCTCRSPK